jgi:hypothetical protein
VDNVLATLEALVTGSTTGSLHGIWHFDLARELDLEPNHEGMRPMWSAVYDLVLLDCAETGGDQVKITPHGHQVARAGGLQTEWPSIFEQFKPLDEDRIVLARAVEISVSEGDASAQTNFVEMKDVLRDLGLPADQGAALAVTHRLKSVRCLHEQDGITTAYCEVWPTYIAVVLTTEKEEAENQALLAQMIEDWETTSVDFKEEQHLNTKDQKAEFCKDVLALANTLVTGRRFLGIGYNDSSRQFTRSVDPSCDAHRMESVLSAYCQAVPEIRYSTVQVTGGTAGIIEVICDRTKLPYRLSRQVGRFAAGTIFVRHNTLNVVASADEESLLVAEGERARAGG